MRGSKYLFCIFHTILDRMIHQLEICLHVSRVEDNFNKITNSRVCFYCLTIMELGLIDMYIRAYR